VKLLLVNAEIKCSYLNRKKVKSCEVIVS